MDFIECAKPTRLSRPCLVHTYLFIYTTTASIQIQSEINMTATWYLLNCCNISHTSKNWSGCVIERMYAKEDKENICQRKWQICIVDFMNESKWQRGTSILHAAKVNFIENISYICGLCLVCVMGDLINLMSHSRVWRQRRMMMHLRWVSCVCGENPIEMEVWISQKLLVSLKKSKSSSIIRCKTWKTCSK